MNMKPLRPVVVITKERLQRLHDALPLKLRKLEETLKSISDTKAKEMLTEIHTNLMGLYCDTFPE